MRSAPHMRLATALILLVAANLFWAGQGVAVKLLVGRLDPLAIALLPFYCITAIGLCILVGRRSFMPRCALAWRFRGEFLVAGICGQFLAQVGMTLGVSWSLASNGAILSLMIPILSALIATWLLGERLTMLRICSLLLGIAGVILLSPLPHSNATGATMHSFAGNLFITAGCMGSAFYNVYSKRLLDRFSDLEILFFSYLASAVVGLPMLVFFAPRSLEDLTRFSMSTWIAFGYLAIFLYGVSMVFFLRALRKVDAIVASTSLYLVPLFGVGMALTILKEPLLPHAIMGSVIVLLATWMLFQFDYVTETST